MSVHIHWFHDDLRLTDNPALAAAAVGCGRLVAVHLVDTTPRAWAPGAASRWWLHHSLAALRDALRARGSELLILQTADPAATLAALARRCGAARLYLNRATTPAWRERQREVASALAGAGCELAAFDGQLLYPPQAVHRADGGPYRVFTAYWRACQRLGLGTAPEPAPARLPPPPEALEGTPLDALKLLPRIRWDTGLAESWRPGEAGALARLERFGERLADYADARDRPAVAGTSRLSPHLHFGEIGPRQIAWALRDHRGAEPYLRELGWREFAHHLLFHFPDTPVRPLDRRFEAFPWRDDPAALRAWQRGETGIPLVDAGMRELWARGWMHNRVRMIAASFLTKNLRLHWLDGAHWFWDTLVDADLANNTLGWQWTAGCGADAAPYFRIFNPVLQAQRFDPDGRYLRRWLPELARLPDRWLARPWQAPAKVLATAGIGLERDYPLPLVDLAESRRAALTAWQALADRRGNPDRSD